MLLDWQPFRPCWREPDPSLVRGLAGTRHLRDWLNGTAVSDVKVMECAGAADWRCEVHF